MTHSLFDMDSDSFLSKEELLKFLDTVARGIAMNFGKNCETVVQELIGPEGDENGEHAGDVYNIAIYNGHVTGRVAGSYIGVFGVHYDIPGESFLNEMNAENQKVVLPDGRIIKSSSYGICIEGHKYLLGINYDCSAMEKAKESIDAFLSFGGDMYEQLLDKGENVMETIFDSCLSIMNLSPDEMKKADRLRLIQMLHERSFFRLQKSVPYAAEKLNVTKFSVYNYLKELNITSEGSNGI